MSVLTCSVKIYLFRGGGLRRSTNTAQNLFCSFRRYLYIYCLIMQRYLCEMFIIDMTMSGLFVTSQKAFQEQCILTCFLRLTLVGGHILYKFHVANCSFACENVLPVTDFSACTIFQPFFHNLKWSGHGRWFTSYMLILLNEKFNCSSPENMCWEVH